MRKSKQPERTCVVCRRKGIKSDLLRFVWNDGKLIWDPHGSAKGRGGYVHRTWLCISKMSEAKRWERVLRLPDGSVTPLSVQDAFKDVKSLVDRNESGGEAARQKTRKIRI